MLKSLIHVNLPSAETERGIGPLEWIRSQFGAEIDLQSGQEELTVSGVTLMTSVVAGFDKAGVTNAIALLVDKNVVYKDVNDEADDLHLIPEAAGTSGILLKPFNEMHMVLTHSELGIHFIFDVRIRNEVMLGEDEMTVAVSGRSEELRIRQGETASAYADRVRGITAQETIVDEWRTAFAAKVDGVGKALEQAMTGSDVNIEAARVEIIRPTRKEVGRFRELTFGDDIKEPTYRAVPTHQRSGAYADPFYYYYYDPYYDFTHYLLLDSVMHQRHWHTDSVAVVNPDGDTLYTGADRGLIARGDAAAHAEDSWEVDRDAVGFGDDGNLAISDEIPTVAVPGGEDWGGSDVDAGVASADSSGGGFFSDFFGGDSGGGDSGGGAGGGDAGASCGSSCGGGCGGCGGG